MIDILDLEKYIAQTERADIRQVYDNLMSGSENHLRAFVQNVDRQTGGTYHPQYLAQEEYNEIINAPMENDRRQGRGQCQCQEQGNGKAGEDSLLLEQENPF